MKRQILFGIFLSSIFCVFILSIGFSQTVDSFFVAGIHPTATLQNSTTGKQLKTLFPWKGKLYSGYGDYGDNTGPIAIYSFSPDSLTFTYEATANTEAVYNYRAINGMLYAPAIDRRGSGDFAKMDSTGIWANYKFGTYNSEHVYDAARFNDSVLFMAGSRGKNATIWKSSNNGKSWNEILSDSAISGKSGDFARFYFSGMYNGNLYVQARDYYGSLHPKSKVYNGASWNDGPSLFPTLGSLGWRPEVFAGKMVYRGWEPGGTTPLRSFDGNNITWVGSLYVFDCFIDSNYMYAVVDSGYGIKNLRRTKDLIIWENLLKVPYTSISLAILNDKLFIGTIDSKILQYTKPVSLLTITLTTPDQILNQDKFLITIHPNPANDIIELSVFKPNINYEVDIINIHGDQIIKIKNENKINISELSSGVYFLKIRQGNNSIVRKLIKQ